MVFRDRGFFFPNIFCWFLCAVNRDEDIVRESFSVKFILHSSWYTPLVYVLWTLFPFGLLCLFFCFFFSQPDVVNITWITGRIHRSIVDKIDQTLWGCRKGKKNTLSITFGHIFLWNMIRRIYLPCFQLISKKYFWWTVTRSPLLFSSKVEEWLMMAIVIEICSLNLFVVLDLDLEPIWIENSFFFCLSKFGVKYYLFYLFWVWKRLCSVRV